MDLISVSDNVRLTVKNPWDDESDDDGSEGAEFLAAAEEGRGDDILMSMLQKNSRLIRTANPVGNTVIHMAARDGNIETLSCLIAFLEETQDEDLKKVFLDGNADGDTALHLALKNRHRKVAQYLIDTEDDANYETNNDGIFPFDLAKKAGYKEMLELKRFQGEKRTGRVDVEMRAIQADLMCSKRSLAVRWTELYRAINKGDTDVLIAGLARGDKELLVHQDHLGETLLHAAVIRHRSNLVSILIQHMISNNMTDAARIGNENGNTALFLAVKREIVIAAECLIMAEPNTVYQVNHEGFSPLYWAVMLGQHNIVKCMARSGCLRDYAAEILSHPNHATLAHLAIKARSFDIFKVLMEHLPQLVKVKNENGWRPLSHAANKGSLNVVTYILTHFPKLAEKCDKDGSFPIHKAVGGGDVDIVIAFLKHCPQALHHVDKKGRSVLHIAVVYGRNNILTYLTEMIEMEESFLQLKDNKGKTFMDYAEDLKQ